MTDFTDRQSLVPSSEAARLKSEEQNAWNAINHPFGSGSCRCRSPLGIQSRLGLLAIGRFGPRPSSCARPRPHGTHLARKSIGETVDSALANPIPIQALRAMYQHTAEDEAAVLGPVLGSYRP
jgi:hypothetical protein